MSGIYLHIPFCKQACTYCDFHFSTSLKYKTEMVDAMVSELEQRLGYLSDKRIETIYFGGGTPSILNERDLGKLFEAVHAHYDVAGNAEITLECNPDDLSNAVLHGLKSLGVNRLSIGLQSFDEAELRWMNRAHTAAESEASVKRAQDKGFENITIDLIYGSKFQSLSDWKRTLRKAIDLQVKHISAYNLTIEDKTKLGRDYAASKEPAINDEKSAEFFLEMIGILEKEDFVHYEISNFGKPDFFSRHNSNYWKGIPYMGLGPSAHSFDGSTRQWNIANNPVYMKHVFDKSLSFFEREELSANDRFNEYMLTGLRTMWGVSAAYITSHFEQEFYFHFLNAVKPYLERGLVLETNGAYTLTRDGKLLADRIASELFI